MIAALTESLTPHKFPVNWFDAALVALLGFGIFRGRKNGMTKEVLPTIAWLVLVAACAFGYKPVAQVYMNSCGLNQLLAAVFGYLSVALVVFFIYSVVRKYLAPRLTGSNFFGNGEYYMGMPSGMLRYACIVIFALAFVNARVYTQAEIEQTRIYNERWYGGGIYSGDYIPDLHSLQASVFEDSFSGPYIKNYLGALLIQGGSVNPSAPAVQKRTPVIHIGN